MLFSFDTVVCRYVFFVLGQSVSLVAAMHSTCFFAPASQFFTDVSVGAIAEITQSLDGNRVFIARLLNTNSHVLVHPVPYFDKNIGRMASLNYHIVPTQFCFLVSIDVSFWLRTGYLEDVSLYFLLYLCEISFGRRLEVLPCTYGYGQTIRKCQGLTLVHGCLFFDSPLYPAARGYGPSASFAIPYFYFVLRLVGLDCLLRCHWSCQCSFLGL